MKKQQNVKDKNELIVNKSDFVMEHKGSFTDNYKVGEELGRGKDEI